MTGQNKLDQASGRLELPTAPAPNTGVVCPEQLREASVSEAVPA